MTTPRDPERAGGHHVSRRAVLLQGLGVLAAIFVVGIVVSKPFMERSLKNDGERALEAQGIAAHLDFTFQDGRLLCADKIPDVDAAVEVVAAVRGVRSVSVDSVCEQGLTPSTVAPTTTTPVPSSTTAPAPETTAATTTTAAAVTTTVVADRPLRITLADGVLTLQGAVASAEQSSALFEAATAVLDGTNVVDGLAVDDALELSDEDVSSISTLIGAMVVPMASAEVGWDGAAVFAEGEYTDQDAATPFVEAAAAAGISAAVTARPTATAGDAERVALDMNEIVADQPLPFGKGQTTLGPEAAAQLQRLAGIAKRFGGVLVEVQGHTDSEGDAGRNLTLSERRAEAVADELVRLGVPAEDVTFRGFGETELILDEDGAELADASRRVVFGVTLR